MGILDKINKKSATTETTPKAEKSPKNKETVVKTANVQKDAASNSQAHIVLVRPLLTEKALMGESNSVYSFVVSSKATKVDIKNAVRDVYGIMPRKVRVLNMDGKSVRFGLRQGRRQDWKKAIISLPKGKTIQIHEGV
ncbi:MAG: 50S ribosomal protein L23 [Candidatus Magasanikbacteria bacterium]|uniref:Large ribosomal subunit protein uL23 n=1 Tax=Candidatus Magasanikbacteria bacterium CG10_big_fil_rev_8_21_14_0_10_38_6 TaxID=1974647 RepID=A0A2M6NZL0_9BACT|nr:50S ribosomal protein L23 [Candidatus Magasanikbacteria bacterium]NCS71920.1 50S ribosomal protein L23 [Candidatus Magasanikbacteria bacterium]PIR76906.1 MAG: 50S ribosomal protein L23 [Candidatus Magasanikbacteria bacterium CG10_big_fil_rev_8_21_14_0_10_38_6]